MTSLVIIFQAIRIWKFCVELCHCGFMSFLSTVTTGLTRLKSLIVTQNLVFALLLYDVIRFDQKRELCLLNCSANWNFLNPQITLSSGMILLKSDNHTFPILKAVWALDRCHKELKRRFPVPVWVLTPVTDLAVIKLLTGWTLDKWQTEVTCLLCVCTCVFITGFLICCRPCCLAPLQRHTLVFWVKQCWTGAAWVPERSGLPRPHTRGGWVRLNSPSPQNEVQ